MMNEQYNILHLIAVLLIIIGSLNWGYVGIFGTSIIEQLIYTKTYRRILYIAICISGLYLIFKKSMWFPQQSSTLLPENIIINSTKSDKYTHIIKFKSTNNNKIIYWTKKYNNYGVVQVDDDGFVRIKINKDKKKDKINKIYYREFKDPYVLGDIKIINY